MVEAKERVLLFFEGLKPERWPIPRSQVQVVFPEQRDREPGQHGSWEAKKARKRAAEAA